MRTRILNFLLVLPTIFLAVATSASDASALHAPNKHCSKSCGNTPVEVVHTYLGRRDGQFPQGGLIADAQGNLYGTTFGQLQGGVPIRHCYKGCGNADGFRPPPDGQRIYQHNFQGDQDGAFPTGELLLLGSTFYGTTEQGGGTDCGGLGCGTVFRFQVDGKEKAFLRFCQKLNCSDGAFPHGSLIADADANLYGTTKLGGAGNGSLCANTFGGCGTVFQVAPDGTRTALYSFCTDVLNHLCADGAVPFGRLLLLNGSLYGTTQFGGANGEGTIFQLSPNGDGTWTETVRYSFCELAGCLDGAIPQAGLTADAKGNLFGTAAYGGKFNFGVVFKFTSKQTLSILHAFKGVDLQDGALPQAELTADTQGNFYGTTLAGGFNRTKDSRCTHIAQGCGSLFGLAKTDSGYSYDVFHVFGLGDDVDGAQPQGSLLPQPDGYLYGTTRILGDPSCACGTLYRMQIQFPGRMHAPHVRAKRRLSWR